MIDINLYTSLDREWCKKNKVKAIHAKCGLCFEDYILNVKDINWDNHQSTPHPNMIKLGQCEKCFPLIVSIPPAALEQLLNIIERRIAETDKQIDAVHDRIDRL